MLRIMRRQAGFTLLELLVAVSVFSILIAIALPVNRELTESNRRNQAVRDMRADIARAQVRSLETGSRGIFTITNSGQSYTFGLDVYPYNNYFVAETTEFVRDFPTGITVAVDAGIIFDSRGYVINQSNLLVTRSIILSNNGLPYTTLSLFPTGVLE